MNAIVRPRLRSAVRILTSEYTVIVPPYILTLLLLPRSHHLAETCLTSNPSIKMDQVQAKAPFMRARRTNQDAIRLTGQGLSMWRLFRNLM